MPYLSKEAAREKRMIIKKAFPDYKFSIRNRHYSSLDVNVLAGPLDLLEGANEYDRKRGNEQINHVWVEKFYGEYPEKAKFLSELAAIATNGKRTMYEDSDYGSIPNFYVRIEIGDWDKPYKFIPKKS